MAVNHTKNLMKFFFLFVYTFFVIFIVTKFTFENSFVKIIEISHQDVFDEQESNQSEVVDRRKGKNYISEQIREITNCTDFIQKPSIRQHGDYWILYNYVPSRFQFECSESITYCTHGDYTFLDNLDTLLSRWNGPISIALYAPGDDFQKTVDSIKYLRQCGPEMISNFVTFHIYFHNQHMPKKIDDYLESGKVNCNSVPYFLPNGTKTYKDKNNLTYPVNIGRNIARNGAQTHFILVSDIELYPSKDIIPKFLEMIVRNGLEGNRKVFPLPIFEVESNQQVPENKTKLQELLEEKKAIFFHQIVCPTCHKVPKLEEWIQSSEKPTLNIFVSGKRTGIFKNWEPIFIGTNSDPFYEERQSWEGMKDKMTQGYALCVLDYEFMVLDNAFLCHRPGIKTNLPGKERYRFMGQTATLINNKILPELKIIYGERKGCEV